MGASLAYSWAPDHRAMTKLLFIAAGGALGAVLRYLLSGWGQGLVHGSLALGTLLVNVTGCLALGFLAGAFAGPVLISEHLRVALTIGLIGGFTTFSTYAWETFALANDGQTWAALINVLLNNILGLAAAFLGYRLAERLYGA